MSDLYDLMTALRDDINAQGFTLNGNPVQAVVRKLPLKQEDIDPATMILVTPGRSERFTQFTFNGHYTVNYAIQIVILSPNNAQESANLETYLDWRQMIADTITGQISPPNFLFNEIEFDPPLDREQINNNFDYLSLEARYTLYY